MTYDLEPCGTAAAYVRHIRDGEDPCRPCKDAKNKTNKANENTRAYQRARIRALGRLSRIYTEAYRALLAEELAKEHPEGGPDATS